MNLDTYLDRQINVRIKTTNDNGLQDYFSTLRYFDYRVGCDVCGCGDAFGFKINYSEIRKKNETFLLNKLKIDENEDAAYNFPALSALNRCTNKDYFRDLFKLKIILDQKCWGIYYYNDEKHEYEKSGCGMTSRFELGDMSFKGKDDYFKECKDNYDDSHPTISLDSKTTQEFEDDYQRIIKRSSSIIICNHCVQCIRLLKPGWDFDNHLTECSPLKIFWVDTVEELLEDLCFEKKSDELYVNKFIKL